MLLPRAIVFFGLTSQLRALAASLATSSTQTLNSRDRSVTVSDALSSAFSSANWIWTSQPSPPAAPAGEIAARRTVTSADRKTAETATIIITVDNLFVLYVNGQPIGATSTNHTQGYDWQYAEKYKVALNSSRNVFAIRAINEPELGAIDGPGPAGILAAIEVSYTDGTTEVFVTDASWKVTSSVLPQFELPQTDDTNWGPAVISEKYGGGPWGKQVSFGSLVPSTFDLSPSQWIWGGTPSDAEPPRSVAFRKTVLTRSNVVATVANVLIAADSNFHLYVNEVYIGTTSPGRSASRQYAQRFEVPVQTRSNLFAVAALHPQGSSQSESTNGGLIVAIQVMYTDKTQDMIYSDETWSVISGIPAGFQLLATGTSTWGQATSYGTFGVQPWGSDFPVINALPVYLANSSDYGPVIAPLSASDGGLAGGGGDPTQPHSSPSPNEPNSSPFNKNGGVTGFYMPISSIMLPVSLGVVLVYLQ